MAWLRRSSVEKVCSEAMSGRGSTSRPWSCFGEVKGITEEQFVGRGESGGTVVDKQNHERDYRLLIEGKRGSRKVSQLLETTVVVAAVADTEKE